MRVSGLGLKGFILGLDVLLYTIGFGPHVPCFVVDRSLRGFFWFMVSD